MVKENINITKGLFVKNITIKYGIGEILMLLIIIKTGVAKQMDAIGKQQGKIYAENIIGDGQQKET
jgi:hypothetical protein